MLRRKWSWSEKILFLTPFWFILVANWMLFVPRDRVFRADLLNQRLFPSRETICRANCSSNLKQIGLALLQYSKDYDDKLPPVAVSATLGWADVAQPYLKSWQIFQCPLVPSKPSAIGFSDYYLNRHLAGQQNLWTSPTNLILAGEGNDGRDWSDSRYSKTELPKAWRTDLHSPAYRHLSDEIWATGSARYLFADGSVRTLTPAQIGENGAQMGVYFFAPHGKSEKREELKKLVMR